MSFLFGRVAPSAVFTLGLRPLNSARPFCVAAHRASLNESDHSVDAAQRSATIDKHKNEQLSKQKQGKGEWKSELSTNSESALKADREDIKDTEEHIQQLQKDTAGKAGRS